MVDLQNDFCESCAKAVAKEKVCIETHSLYTAPLQRYGGLETMKLYRFLLELYPNMALYLPLAAHIVAVYMQFERVSAAHRWITITPRKKHVELLKRFANLFFLIREEWPVADAGI